jgi:hypothetical protein
MVALNRHQLSSFGIFVLQGSKFLFFCEDFLLTLRELAPATVGNWQQRLSSLARPLAWTGLKGRAKHLVRLT